MSRCFVCDWFVLLLLLAWVAGCTQRAEPPQVTPSPPPRASDAGSTDPETPSAPYDPRPGVHAAAATGRPLVGMVWAFPSVVRQSPLTAEERAMLGEFGGLAPEVPLPDLSGASPAMAEWEGGGADAVWTLRTSAGQVCFTAWLEVLSGSAGAVRAATVDEVMERWSSSAVGGVDAPTVTLQGQDAASWGLETPESTAAMAAMIWARLGRADRAAEWAQRAGRPGFEALPSALAYRAHRMALEGLSWGFDRRVSARLLAVALDQSERYAGCERLVEDEAILREMARQDGVPPSWGEAEPPGTLPWARYQAWRLRDAGLPSGLEYTCGEGDPVVALLQGGRSALVAAQEMLTNESFTRVLATDAMGPIPDLLRIGDLAYDIIAATTGRHHLESRGVTRLFALPPQQRRVVAEEIASEVGFGEAPEEQG